MTSFANSSATSSVGIETQAATSAVIYSNSTASAEEAIFAASAAVGEAVAAVPSASKPLVGASHQTQLFDELGSLRSGSSNIATAAAVSIRGDPD